MSNPLFPDMYIPDRHDTEEPLNKKKKKDEDEGYTYDNEDSKSDEENLELFDACREGDLEKVYSLLKDDEVNQRDLDGEALLHIAVAHGHINVVKFLISKNANVNCISDSGVSCLHLAAKNNHLRICQLLIEKGADVNHLNVFGQNALHYACLRKGDDSSFVVQLLESSGININQVDCLHRTPLHYASEEKQKATCKYLLLKGAKWEIKDIEEKVPQTTSLDSATRKLFDRVTVFKFSFGQGEDEKIKKLKKELERYKRLIKKNTLLYVKKENELFKKELDQIKEKA